MKFDDCSRDELLEFCKRMEEHLLRQSNQPPVSICPFCYGNKTVPTLKCQMKDALISEWHKEVTQEEYEAWWAERQKEWAKK